MSTLVIDNYDSFTYNLVAILKQLKVAVTVKRNDAFELDEVAQFDHLIFSPGPGIPSEAGQLPELIEAYRDKIPMLGICLGHQAIAEVFGAELVLMDKVVHGKSSEIKVTRKTPLFQALPKQFAAARYHSWAVQEDSLPATLEVIASTQDEAVMAIQHTELPVYGLQFHPESIMCPSGQQIIQNFLAA